MNYFAVTLGSPGRSRRDLGIGAGPDLIIVEAERGWVPPEELQLGAYAQRASADGGGVLVSLSEASPDWAVQLLLSSILGIPVIHLPRTAVRGDIDAARRTRSRPGTAVAR
jgi:hypothetical protein